MRRRSDPFFGVGGRLRLGLPPPRLETTTERIRFRRNSDRSSNDSAKPQFHGIASRQMTRVPTEPLPPGVVYPSQLIGLQMKFLQAFPASETTDGTKQIHGWDINVTRCYSENNTFENRIKYRSECPLKIERNLLSNILTIHRAIVATGRKDLSGVTCLSNEARKGIVIFIRDRRSIQRQKATPLVKVPGPCRVYRLVGTRTDFSDIIGERNLEDPRPTG